MLLHNFCRVMQGDENFNNFHLQIYKWTYPYFSDFLLQHKKGVLSTHYSFLIHFSPSQSWLLSNLAIFQNSLHLLPQFFPLCVTSFSTLKLRRKYVFKCSFLHLPQLHVQKGNSLHFIFNIISPWNTKWMSSWTQKTSDFVK